MDTLKVADSIRLAASLIAAHIADTSLPPQ